MAMKWNNYTDIYDIYKNGTCIKRCWGKKASIRLAEAQSGTLFGADRIEVVNIHTGEIILQLN